MAEGKSKMALTFQVFQGDQLIRTEELSQDVIKVGKLASSHLRIDDENDSRLNKFAGKADRVLVDAPCSGLGTLKRNPDLKWRQSPTSVKELAVKQANILSAASRLVKPGGRLVYATCSLLADENEKIAEGFMQTHTGWSNVLSTLRAGEEDEGTKYTQLLPHRDGCDGFFAAVFEKTE